MKKISLILLFALITLTSLAQHRTSMQTAPVDTALHMGVLENGLMYMIQRADLKKGVADFRLVQATGSLVEEDNQRGIAHFLEHMAFKGTKHFQGRAILDFLRRNGAQFGPDINAQTMMDHTKYILKEVPMHNQAMMDSCLLILRDWAGDITFDSKALEAERNVIVEEWRARSTMVEAIDMSLHMYDGTRYADRDPIGDLDVVRTCTAEQMKAFYHKWYQPQHQCIIVTGDIAPTEVEAKIKRLFGDLKPGMTELPMKIVLRSPQQPRVLSAQDKRQNVARFEMASLQPRAIRKEQRLVGNLMREYVNELAIKCIGNRLNRLKQNKPSYLMLYLTPYATTNADNYSVNDLMFASTASDLRENIAALLIELERAKRFGFTEKELSMAQPGYKPSEVEEDRDTTVIDFDDPTVNSNSSKSGRWLANELVNHALHHTLPHSPKSGKIMEDYFNKHITPEMVRQALFQLFPTRQSFFITLMPEGEEAPSEDEIIELIEGVERMQLDPYTDKANDAGLSSTPTIDPTIDPEKGTVKSSKVLKGEGLTEYKLSNGVTVVMNNVPDSTSMRTQIRALLRGGESLLGNDEVIYEDFIKGTVNPTQPAPSYALHHPSFTIPMTFESNYTLYKYDHWDGYSDVLQFDGEEPANADSLRQVEKVRSDSLNAIGLEVLFQKFYKTLTSSEVDSARWASDYGMLQFALSAISNRNLQAQLRLANFAYPVNARHPEWGAEYTSKMIKTLNKEDLQKIQARLRSNYNGLTVVINTSHEPASLLPFIEQYVASLPSQDRPVQDIARPENHVKTYDDQAVAYIDNASPIAQVVLHLYQEKAYTYDSQSVAHGEALENVLNQLLINHIRIKHSDVYSITANLTTRLYPFPLQGYTIQFTCAPERTDAIVQDIKALFHEIADGDLLTQTLLDSYVNAKENAVKSKENAGDATANKPVQKPFDIDRYVDRLASKGTIIERDNLDIVHSVTPSSLRRFVKELLQKGHIYEFTMKTE